MKRFLLWACAFLVLLAAGLYALSFIAFENFKPRIERTVEDATGRSFSIGGSIHAGLSLYPTVVVQKVTLGNPEWAGTPHFFDAEEAEIRVALLPLLRGDVVLGRIALKGASLNLETDGKGEENWIFGERRQDTGEARGFSIADLPMVLFENVAIEYRAGPGAAPLRAELDVLEVTPRGGPADVRLTGQLNGTGMELKVRIEGSEERFSAAPFELSYGSYSLSGGLEGERSGTDALFEVKGDLQTDVFDITPLLGGDGGGRPEGRVFSADPLPFDVLTAGNARIDVSVGRLIYRKAELQEMQASAVLKDGVLELPVTASYRGAPLEAKLSAAEADTPRAGLEIKAPQLDVGGLLKDLDVTGLAEMTGQLGIDVEGRGTSLREIAGSLNGEIGLVTGKGRINSSAFELIAADLVFALIPRGEEANVAQVSCFASHTTFRNGTGTVDQFVLATQRVRTYGSGTVNLKNERLDLTLEPKPVDASLLSLATPIRVRGTLASPSASLDSSALMGDVAMAVGAGIMTGGVGAILPFMSTGDTASDTQACLRMAAEEGRKGIIGRAGSAAKDVIEGTGDVMEGIGDFLTSPFRRN